jgi:hypothetical protein
MKLLTKQIINTLPKLYETESIPMEDKKVITKFFNPTGAGTWYVIEGQQEEDDFIFFGLVDLYEKEFGYFSLKELESIRLPWGLKIERDIHFNGKLLGEIYDGD